ncbi:MAG: MBL fold metallo-hydrolase [Spirochaetaceae bacterium]|nr:MAG: MBL fold metallo-hydrolase [Spirochaetaceae bacterium]
MRVVFFGTAGAVQDAADSNVCFAVRADGCSFLVDASGSPVHNLIKAGLDPLSLDALVLTHSHADHIYGVPSLIHNLWLMKRSKPLQIISNPPTSAKTMELLECFGLLKKEGLFPIEWIDGEKGVVEMAASLNLKLFPVQHSIPTSGIRVEERAVVFVYTSDTAPFDGLFAASRDCQVLIHEASGDISREKYLNQAGHSSARQAGEAAARSGVGRLFLCHFDYFAGPSPRDLLKEAQASFNGDVVIPELFQEYMIRDA